MIRAIMHGCNGKMGQVISNIIASDDEIEIVAGIDLYDGIKNPYPVFKSLAECDVKADVVIDFASVQGFDALLDYSLSTKTPVVICTTGLTQEQIERIGEVSKSVALLRSANMSLGINLLLNLLKNAAEVLAPAGFDIEIVEKHHNLKKDAPSGTAIALADSINEQMGNRYHYVYDRSQDLERRTSDEIGISAVRGGTIVGDHDVIFAGEDEVITFSHTAYSKAIFGKGAVEAAKFLKDKPAGLYNMQDVIHARG